MGFKFSARLCERNILHSFSTCNFPTSIKLNEGDDTFNFNLKCLQFWMRLIAVLTELKLWLRAYEHIGWAKAGRS